MARNHHFRALKTGVLETPNVLALPTGNRLAWWNANQDVYEDTGLTDLCEDGDPIAGWKDQNGVNHVTQSTAGDRMIYRANAAVLNNKPALECVSSDYLSRNATGLLSNLNTYSIFVVFASASGAPAYFYGEGKSDNAAPFVGARINTAAVEGAHRDDASVLANPSGGSGANSGKHILTVRRITSNSWAVRLDGVQVATASNTPTTTTTDRIAIGALIRTSVASFVTALIGQVALYSADNFSVIEPLLAREYGIALP